MSKRAAAVDVAMCVCCGCDDLHACDLGCSWLRVDRTRRLGICSEHVLTPMLRRVWRRIRKLRAPV